MKSFPKTVVLIIVLFGTVPHFVKAQNETSEKQSPFTFETSYLGDVVNNLVGGIQKGTRYLGMANIRIGMDTEKAGLHKGGEFYINAANTHGGTPSSDLFGDFQVISNIEAGNLTYIQELWYKQTVRKVSLILGLQDLNTEFISSEYASLFINSSFGTHSNIADNLPVPIFPLTSLGFQVHYGISEAWTIKTAFFDGVPEDFETNPYNLQWNLKKEDGFLWFTEICRNDVFRMPGTYKLGWYYHNAHKVVTVIENQTIVSSNPANYGIYMVVDQRIITTESGKKLSVFAKGSFSPRNINLNCYYFDFGMHFKGVFGKRKEDIIGIATAHAGMHGATGSETVIELYYQGKFGEHLLVQPDLQYIINPAGTDIELDNALGAILRLQLTF
jgi:porin